MNLTNDLKTHFATKTELHELQKAMQTTTTADSMITIDYDKDLQKEVYHVSPFLTYCEQNGIVSSAQVSKVGYRTKKQKTKSSFIPEGAEIPAHDPSLYEDEVVKMSTLVYPIEVSDLSVVGVDAVDVLDDEITDGFLDMAATKDATIIQATGENNNPKGLIPSITTHTSNNGGNVIEKDLIDSMAQDIIDEGGSPSAILTTAKVGRQLNDILYPTIRNVDKVELGLGYWVTAYNAPNGTSIPIIVDQNIDTTNGDSLTFLDNTSFKIRELTPPSIKELAATKLSTSKVLFTYFTCYNRAEYRNGVIKNIGSTEA